MVHRGGSSRLPLWRHDDHEDEDYESFHRDALRPGLMLLDNEPLLLGYGVVWLIRQPFHSPDNWKLTRPSVLFPDDAHYDTAVIADAKKGEYFTIASVRAPLVQ
jgi:hypothetical protein